MDAEGRILVAEDEPDTLHGLERILGREGYRVDAVQDGLEATEKLKFERYDAVVSDLRMPLVDGMDLLHLAKEKDEDIVFVMITGYGTPENAVDAMKLGATDFIAKPFAPADLVGAIEKGLKGRRHEPTPWGDHVARATDIRRFRQERAWAATRPDGSVVIGADEEFFREAGEVVFCDLPLRGDEVVRGRRCARTIDTTGLVHRPFKSPLSGSVVEVNDKMEHEPWDARNDPYGEGWLFRIAPSRLEEGTEDRTPGVARDRGESEKADVVVIGGSAAGLTAAITARRHYPDKRILLIRREKQVAIPCGIPYIFGTVGSPDKNLIPDAVLKKHNIELIVDEVVDIYRSGHLVTTSKGHMLGYEKLILATGSVPAVPSIPGTDLENVFVVKKDVPHLERMLDQLEHTSDLVIVGGGFIGMEIADECRKNRDIRITVVEALPHCLLRDFDEATCVVAESIARAHGVEILARQRVEAFVGNGKVTGARLVGGRELKADMVILGVGCAANTKLAEGAGLALGPTGGVQVDCYMQTSDGDILACGDCAEKVSFFDGTPSNLKLASVATREARIAGANLFGRRRTNDGVIAVFSTVVDETAFASAGLLEREARSKGYEVAVGEAEAPNRHPGGMPGMASLKVKLVFEKRSGRILGGQVVGAKCGGELINAISACIHEKMTAEDIALFPMGTHPALTASPIAYQLTNAAEAAIGAMRKSAVRAPEAAGAHGG